MQPAPKRKVTVSLDADLVDLADSKAVELGTTRSQIIDDLLREMRRRELDELACEGYRFFAHEAEEFAASSMRVAHEVLDDDSPAR
jgi:metal-responsive CopG/Arc/MetJ family transcriptional regulator